MTRPLVVITRDERDDGRLAAALEARGLATFPLETVAVQPGPELQRLDALLSEIGPEDWLIFTSGHAVDVVCARPGWPSSESARPRLAAVGGATAARLRERGAAPELVASGPGARSLAEALASYTSLRGIHVVWPRSSIARRELAERLAAAGAHVSEVVAYRIEPITSPALPEFRQLLAEGRLAAITFLSPSSAHGLATALGAGDLAPLVGRVLVASIGPSTSEALRKLLATPQLEARSPSIETLAEDLAAALARATA